MVMRVSTSPDAGSCSLFPFEPMTQLSPASSPIVKPAQNRPTRKFFNSLGIFLGFWLLPAFTSTPVIAAERINISLEILERSISINALEAYAREGKIPEPLAPITKYFSPEQMAQFRQILLTRAQVSPVAVSQFLYTPQAEYLLQRLGEVITTESGQPGARAIRAALITSAASPEGLTLLNVLRKFPAQSIRIDLARSLQIADSLSKVINQTNQAIAAVSQQSAIEAAKTPTNLPQLTTFLNLQKPGSYTWRKIGLRLNDFNRNRSFPADIYLPTQSDSQQALTQASVIVISHGLGEDRTTFAYLAEQLASYGFAVAVPEHPGSSARQIQDLLSGRANQVSEPDEFINRPLDVKFLLDQLANLSQSDSMFQGRLNLQEVGVIGHSYGGYTALVLAGATLNFPQLQQNCQSLKNSWNLSLLLQCRALQLEPVATKLLGAYKQLRDERVKAAIAINPITSSILGPVGLSQVKVPVMIVASGADTVTPIVEEQIQPFTWLTTPNKYLVVIEDGTHFSTLGEADLTSGIVPLPTALIGPNPNLGRRYLRALSTTFFETYIANRSEYRPLLSASYVKALGQDPLKLRLVKSFSTQQLAAALERANSESAKTN